MQDIAMMGSGENMQLEKKNCWEIKGCQREPGGANVAEMGVCPAATDTCYDGINSGKNAGRICWAVAGTCCEGEVQGTFAEKRLSCITCEVYEKIQEEEGGSTSASKLMDFLSKNENSRFVSMVGFKKIKAGERFITQGEQGDEAYIIQRGSCLLMLEKHGGLHRVGYRGRGDIVGEGSPLTGEPRSAHVEAETNMELWVLKRDFFENITEDQPELMEFLDELVEAGFDSKRYVADTTR